MLRRRLYRWQQRHAPYVFVAPFLLTFTVFGLYPIVKSLVWAFYKTNGPKWQEFRGLENFAFMLGDPSFWTALRNTATFAAASVLVQLPLALGLAVLLNSPRVRARNAYRFGFFSPFLVGTVFAAFLFQFVFAPRFGLLNKAIAWLGLGAGDTAWLQMAPLVMPALVTTALWMYVGYNMVYFLAALQGVDRTLYDAAAVDGAGAWKRFQHVTIPGILPVMVFVVMMSTIGSFKLFELPYLMLSNTSGPEQSGLTVVMYLYQKGFEAGDLGYASTVGWTLVVLVVGAALAGLALSRLVRKVWG